MKMEIVYQPAYIAVVKSAVAYAAVAVVLCAVVPLHCPLNPIKKRDYLYSLLKLFVYFPITWLALFEYELLES